MQGTKEVLLNKLSRAIKGLGTRNTESKPINKGNEPERNTLNTSDARISIELVK